VSLEIRPAQTADRESIRRVVEAAFADHGEEVANLVEALDAARRTRLSLVAEYDGAVVGHVQLSQSWIDARERLLEVLVLSPLGVLPERQHQGIGSKLVAAALAGARELGAPAVFLEGDPGYYSKRGFEPGAAHGVTPPSVRIPAPAFQVVVLDADALLPGALVYCDAFWELDCVGLRDPRLAQVEQALAARQA
jgi:putative acetyltransferase